MSMRTKVTVALVKVTAALVSASGLLMLTTAPTIAVDPLNEFSAYIVNAVSPVYDGLRGNMNIRTDPATDPDVTYAHPTQVDVGSSGGDFIAIGTYNGAPFGNCSGSPNPLWSGYYDGIIGGNYICGTFDSNAYGIGANPSFKIYYEAGTLCGGNRWILSLNGITRACLVTGNSSGQGLQLGLETASLPPDPTDRNIDVKYTNLNRNQTNGTDWRVLGQPQLQNISCCYNASVVSDTAYNFYLAPLD
jgi:hypothetical protein